MDLAGTDKAVKRVNDETIPKVKALLDEIVSDVDAIVSRLDGATIEITIHLKEKGNNDEDPNTAHSTDAATLPCHGGAESS